MQYGYIQTYRFYSPYHFSCLKKNQIRGPKLQPKIRKKDILSFNKSYLIFSTNTVQWIAQWNRPCYKWLYVEFSVRSTWMECKFGLLCLFSQSINRYMY